MGTRIASNVRRTAPTSSMVETVELARPPVVPDEVARRTTVPAWMTVAIPPPAMMAMDHLRNGEMSPKTEAVAMMPAATAAGVVRASITLSTHGM